MLLSNFHSPKQPTCLSRFPTVDEVYIPVNSYQRDEQRHPTCQETGTVQDTFFTNKEKMKESIQRVNVDFTVEMLAELDTIAGELNVSRQALIKTYLRQILDQHYLAKNTVK